MTVMTSTKDGNQSKRENIFGPKKGKIRYDCKITEVSQEINNTG